MVSTRQSRSQRPSFQSDPSSNGVALAQNMPNTSDTTTSIHNPIKHESQSSVESSVDDELAAVTRRRSELAKRRQVRMLKEKIAALEREEADGSNIPLDDQFNVPSDDGDDGQPLPRIVVGSVAGSVARSDQGLGEQSDVQKKTCDKTC